MTNTHATWGDKSNQADLQRRAAAADGGTTTPGRAIQGHVATLGSTHTQPHTTHESDAFHQAPMLSWLQFPPLNWFLNVRPPTCPESSCTRSCTGL